METIKEFKVHPLASRLPLMGEREFEELKKSIRRDGLLMPIILTDNNDLVIDGRNRLRACLEMDVKPWFVPLSKFLEKYEDYVNGYTDFMHDEGLIKDILKQNTETVIEQVINLLNVNRRHLSNFEKFLSLTDKKRFVEHGEIGKNHENVRVLPGSTLKTDDKTPITLSEAAKELNVSTKTIQQMKAIAEKAPEELKEEVKKEKVSVKAAYNELVKTKKPKQAPKHKPEPIPEPIPEPVPEPINNTATQQQQLIVASLAKPKNWFEANLKSETDRNIAKTVHNLAATLINERGISYAPIVLSWLRKIGKTETFNEIQTWKLEN